jgi:hypothetical protein
MPNQNKAVVVTFNPPDPNNTSWSFNKKKIQLQAGESIVMSRNTTSTPPWVFVEPQTHLPSGCTGRVLQGGTKLQIDRGGQDSNGYVPYSIMVSWNGTLYTSPMTSDPAGDGDTGRPPMLMND